MVALAVHATHFGAVGKSEHGAALDTVPECRQTIGGMILATRLTEET